MEILVNMEVPSILDAYVYLPLSFEASLCVTLLPSDLPADWDVDPAPVSTKNIGSRWIKDKTSLVLAVPSVVVRQEINYLINPDHPDFSKIHVGTLEDFKFDPRLMKKIK